MVISWEEALGRSASYELLALAFLYPGEGTRTVLAEKARREAILASTLGRQEQQSILAKLSQDLDCLGDDVLVDHYIELFGHAVSADCPPYEGEYGQAHIFQKSATLADLNSFYKAFGVDINPAFKDRPDHVSVEMEFMHLLTLKEAYAQLHNHGEDKVLLCRSAQEAFLSHHLANWIKTFAHKVQQKAGAENPYTHLAHLLEIHMDREFKALGINPGPYPPPDTAAVAQDDQACDAVPILPTTM